MTSGIGVFTASIILNRGGVTASRILHYDLLLNCLRSPLSFFDTTPVGRILNRFAKDIDVIDHLIGKIASVLGCAMKVLSSLLVMSVATPLILVASAPLVLLYTVVQVADRRDVSA